MTLMTTNIANAGPSGHDESIADAKTGNPSTGLKRDSSSGDANPEKSLNYGKLSSQEEDTMNIEPKKAKNTSVPQPTRPQKQIRKRKSGQKKNNSKFIGATAKP